MKNSNAMIAVGVVVLALGGWLLFGRGESAAVPVGEAVMGQWQSDQDANLVREFKADNAVTDWYGGAEVMTGYWEIFDGSEAPASLVLNDDEESVYLRMTLTGKDIDSLYFRVSEVTENTLELVYIGPGGVMTFTRVGAEVETEEAE